MQKTLFPGYSVGTDAYEDIRSICPAYGKKAAVNIDKYLGGSGELNMGEWLEIPVIPDMEVTEPHMRFPVRTLPVDERIDNFKEVACGFHKLDAIGEAFRCLHCDRR